MSSVAPLCNEVIISESISKSSWKGQGVEEAYSGNVIRGHFVNACTKTGRDLSGSVTCDVLY